LKIHLALLHTADLLGQLGEFARTEIRFSKGTSIFRKVKAVKGLRGGVRESTPHK